MKILLHRLQQWLKQLNPWQTIVLGYFTYILVIFLPLCLPITWKANNIRPIDHLFMATSAVSTTGLVTVNTPDAYNFWGQFIILIGFQIGGLGYMTFGSFLIMASRKAVSESRLTIGKAVFSMPEQFEPASFIRRAVLFTLAVEFIGAVLLYFAMANAGVASPLWPAIFHAVSAFCTAGFSVFPNSLESFRGDTMINVIIGTLSVFGAIGFIVISDLWLKIRNRTHPMTLTSRIILIATFGGIAIGTFALYLDDSLVGLPTGERFLAAFFQSLSALTTVGFNTHPIGAISQASLMILLVMMILGASPSGTGGGLKSTSWSAGIAVGWSSLRGRKLPTFFGHPVPQYRIQAAFSAVTLYLCAFVVGCFLLLLADQHSFEDVIFEVASALGTVGLSRGMTPELTFGGKILIIALMFLGRVGVLSLGIAALGTNGSSASNDTKPEQDIVI